jgi:hypothetical protein
MKSPSVAAALCFMAVAAQAQLEVATSDVRQATRRCVASRERVATG